MEAIDTAYLCGGLAEEKKAKDVQILELVGLTDIADYFLVMSGTTDRHVRTISEHIEKEMKERGVRPFSVEGTREGRWVILDYRNVVVHIFVDPLRELYDIESLWLEAKRLRMKREITGSEVGHGQEDG